MVAQEIADVETEGRPQRWYGTQTGYEVVPLDRDPTTQLLEFAASHRDELIGGILGDLRAGGEAITRWEYHAAPSRIDLSPGLQERLEHCWKERPPRQLPHLPE